LIFIKKTERTRGNMRIEPRNEVFLKSNSRPGKNSKIPKRIENHEECPRNAQVQVKQTGVGKSLIIHRKSLPVPGNILTMFPSQA
jgi:hypothetical protein